MKLSELFKQAKIAFVKQQMSAGITGGKQLPAIANEVEDLKNRVALCESHIAKLQKVQKELVKEHAQYHGAIRFLLSHSKPFQDEIQKEEEKAPVQKPD